MKSFLALFSEQQRESLIQKLDSQFKEFYAICEVKDVTPLDQLGTSTELERKTAELIIEEAERKYAENSAIPL